MPAAFSFWTLVWASTQPVVKVILLCSIGALCSRKGIIDYNGRKTLSTLAFLVFIPALNFTSIGGSLSGSRLLQWWPLMLNMVFSLLIGGAVGYLNAWIVKPEPWFRKHTIAAVMFGNTGNLPLVIVSTLARASASILGGIDPAQAEALAVAYVTVGVLFPSLLIPTLGFRLLAKDPPAPAAAAAAPAPIAAAALAPAADAASPYDALRHVEPPADVPDVDDAEAGCSRVVRAAAGLKDESTGATAAFWSQHHHHQQQRLMLSRYTPEFLSVRAVPLPTAFTAATAARTAPAAPPPSTTNTSTTNTGIEATSASSSSLHHIILPPGHPAHLLPSSVMMAAVFNCSDDDHHCCSNTAISYYTAAECTTTSSSRTDAAAEAAAAPFSSHPGGIMGITSSRPEDIIATTSNQQVLRCPLCGIYCSAASSTDSTDRRPLHKYVNYDHYLDESADCADDDACQIQKQSERLPLLLLAAGDQISTTAACEARPNNNIYDELPQPLCPQDKPAASSAAIIVSSCNIMHPAGPASKSMVLVPHHPPLLEFLLKTLKTFWPASSASSSRTDDVPLSFFKKTQPGHDEEHHYVSTASSSNDRQGLGGNDSESASAGGSLQKWLTKQAFWHNRSRGLGNTLIPLLLRDVLSPYILSTFLGIFVGCIPALQGLFFGSCAPLSLLTDCLSTLAGCAIPTILIGLGATLGHGPGAAKVPFRIISSVCVCRLGILPLWGIAVVLGGYAAGTFQAPDPVFLLVMLIQNTAPTAILVHTMSAVHQNYEAEVSAMLFWQYLLSIITIPPYLSLYLWALGALGAGAQAA